MVREIKIPYDMDVIFDFRQCLKEAQEHGIIAYYRHAENRHEYHWDRFIENLRKIRDKLNAIEKDCAIMEEIKDVDCEVS